MGFYQGATFETTGSCRREANLPAGPYGLAAAIWGGGGSKALHELSGDCDPETHVLGVALNGFDLECFSDHRRIHRGPWKQNRAQLMPAGVKPRALIKDRWRILHLFIPDRMIAAHLDVAPGCVELIDPLGAADPVLAEISAAVVEAMSGSRPMSLLHAECQAVALVVHLVRRWSNHAGGAATKLPPGGLATWQVRRVTGHIQDRLADDVSLVELAALVGLSPRHLCTAFRQSTGLPPHRWQIERRVERAKEMLADPSVSVTDVALACGFGSSAHFATMFRRATGRSPREWRRERAS